jgi:hypothetical protein
MCEEGSDPRLSVSRVQIDVGLSHKFRSKDRHQNLDSESAKPDDVVSYAQLA